MPAVVDRLIATRVDASPIDGFGPLDVSYSIAGSLGAFCDWLDQTDLSQTIQVTSWIVPAVQSVHILAITAVAVSALMIDLRLIGAFATDQPMRRVASRFLPFVWWPLLILLGTGVILIIGEPVRSLMNPIFQIKMVLLAAAIIVTGLLQYLQRRDPAFGDSAHRHRGAATAIAVLSMLLWAGIIFAGRWIAYYA